MKLDEPLAVLVQDICSEWNRAERAIKIAEQVIGEDPFPSIKELRYAGRRIVEAFLAIEDAEGAKSVAMLQDAYFDCLRAKHDAMDVAINEIAGRIRLSQEDLGVHVVLQAFPEFPKLLQLLVDFENNIADSRENRADRDATYENIQENFDSTLKLYDKFKVCEELMKNLADESALKAEQLEEKERSLEAKAKRESFISKSIGIGGIIVAVVFGYLGLG